MNNIKLAIVGATGLVGQTIIKVLEEKKLSINEYAFFASSKSAGKKLNLLGNTYIVKELTYSSFDSNFNFAIFSAGGNVSKEFAPIAVSKGCTVIDNSSYFRMDPNVPLVVPEVNFSDANKNTGIIANPNCSTIQAVVALKPLDDKYKIKRIVYNTYQAVSGAGYKGVNDLKNGIENFDKELSIFENQKTSYELQKFNVSIFNNCIPHIDMLLDNGYSKEEEKMINETRKILNNPNLKITATTVRVPVLNSHCESINVELENEFKLEELKQILKKSPGVVLKDDDYPTTLDSNNNDNVFIGRVRRDFSVPSGINFWVVADNLRKGAASNAIQILEGLIRKSFC
ncbi:aspartate-semialdehyde dehydrogenase [Clostridium sp. CAG:567]|jgi:aspartate-semialdehyde dehydrogenase|nr:aspartate-semialdehyde dehydrogenase [Clostridium sp. CAG:567]